MRFTLSLLLLTGLSLIAPAQTELQVVSDSTQLYGTLLPVENSSTVVLIIAGSGPTDRNGNAPLGLNTNAYQMLAQELQQAGLASLRYDKRGIGQSRDTAAREEDLVFGTLVNDARAWISLLEQRYERVVILGHSEGALVGTLAAQHTEPAALIALSGAGLPADSVLKEQINRQNPLLLPTVTPYLDSLKQGRRVQAPAYLNSLFRPSVQPFLMSWFALDPARELGQLDCPILVIGGTSDIQVPPAYAQRLAEHASQAELVIIPELTHTLKQAPEGDLSQGMATYSQPDLPLHPTLVRTIISFIENL